MTRADRRTLVRQLAGQGLSRRAIAKRLKVSKDTVRRDLIGAVPQDAPDSEPDNAPPSAPEETGATQVSAGAVEDSEPDSAPPGEPDAPVAQLLVIDLSRFPGLADDLALLQQCTGVVDRAEVVDFAVDKIAVAYRAARRRGLLAEGQAFDVTGMHLRPGLRARTHA